MPEMILIVDDEPELVRPLEFAFKREGFQTRIAHDGRTALARAAELPRPDVVLLDLMLPDISGTEVCRRLKADPSTRSIPVIMVTARGEEIDRVVGFEVGADDYVVKPFSTRELVLRARAVMRRNVAEAAPVPVADITTFGRLRVDEGGHRVWV
ncbi:MAG: response regulator, partial [Myxococcota bacterium]|nr:response regulator [Myxococcota bacterium]